MIDLNIPPHSRRITHLVIHCTATPQTTTVDSIKNHWRNVLKWRSPGYHYIIKADGAVEFLQPEKWPTNGVAGHNANSIHISYIGGVDGNGKSVDNRTEKQKEALHVILTILKSRYPAAIIQGHRDFGAKKDCPCFNAKKEYASY